MEHFIKAINGLEKLQHESLIVRNIISPLSSIPFHRDVQGIERTFARGFPLHLAIHEVQGIEFPPEPYTQPHLHDFAEINILVGNDLTYRIQLDHEIYELKGSYSIWIPAGTLHAANVIAGTGCYITIRLNPPENI